MEQTAPVTARSLVIDLFGDYLRYRGGQVRLQAMTELLACFGVPQSTVRVCMTRLQRDGWLTSERNGRQTTYALTDAAWRMLDEGRQRIFRRTSHVWDGRWSMVIFSVPEQQRALRETARRELTWLGFGRLANSVWINAHDRLAEARAALPDHPDATVHLLHTRSEGLREDREMARTCWDLDDLAADYATLLSQYRKHTTELAAAAPTDREALVRRVTLIREYRRLPYRDPDLPADLLPPSWPGTEAHQAFLDLHTTLKAPAERAVDTLLQPAGTHTPA